MGEPAPLCVPIPNLSRTFLTSFELSPLNKRCRGRLALHTLGDAALSPDAPECVAPILMTEGARPCVSATLDTQPRPSNASRKSFTLTPRFDRVRLWRERFDMCINAGEILRRGLPCSGRGESPFAKSSTAFSRYKNNETISNC